MPDLSPIGNEATAMSLSKLLKRPRYLPRPTREEIVAAALEKLCRDLAVFRRAREALKDTSP